MTDPHQNKQKINPKVIERLEDDWDYDVDSFDDDGELRSWNFSFRQSIDFLIRVIRTPLRMNGNAVANIPADETEDGDEYLDPAKPEDTFFQKLITLPGKLIFSPLSILSLFYVSWLHTDELDNDLNTKERSSKLFGRAFILLVLI